MDEIRIYNGLPAESDLRGGRAPGEWTSRGRFYVIGARLTRERHSFREIETLP